MSDPPRFRLRRRMHARNRPECAGIMGAGLSLAQVEHIAGDPKPRGFRTVGKGMAADDSTGQDADATILHQIVGRDPRGIEQLYDRYGGIAFALAYRLLRERGAAEDVVQEAFLNIWRQGA